MTRALALSLLVCLGGGGAACLDGAVPIGTDRRPLALAPDEAEACRAYCAEADDVGCPREGDCMALCADLRDEAPACVSEIDAYIACAAANVDPDTCGDLGACRLPLEAYAACSSSDQVDVADGLRGGR